MTTSQEKVVEVIREVHFRKFPATQTWNIFLTTERIIFQLASRGTEEVLFGILGGIITWLFRSTHQKSPNEISINDVLSRSLQTLIIDAANASNMSLKSKSILLWSGDGRMYKFDFSGKKMYRFRELVSQYPWAK